MADPARVIPPVHDQNAISDALRTLTERLSTGASTKPRPQPHVPREQDKSQASLDERGLTQVLHLVQHASEALHHLDERRRKAEDQLLIVSKQASDELNLLRQRLRSVEALLPEAEARAQAAEQRALVAEERLRTAEGRAEVAERQAQEAREWLVRFRDTITSAFPASLKDV